MKSSLEKNWPPKYTILDANSIIETPGFFSIQNLKTI